jgi:hypothetical protein
MDILTARRLAMNYVQTATDVNDKGFVVVCESFIGDFDCQLTGHREGEFMYYYHNLPGLLMLYDLTATCTKATCIEATQDRFAKAVILQSAMTMFQLN